MNSSSALTRWASIHRPTGGSGAGLLALLVTVVLLGCTPQLVAEIDVPGYPPCVPGSGGDLRSEVTEALTVRVKTEEVAQKMLGFGASDCWSIQFVGQWPLAKREAIADLLFESGLDPSNDPMGIGLSVWRFNIGAGSSRQGYIIRPWRRADTFFNDDFSGYDWTRLPGQRWFLSAAKERGVDRFIAFVNSPPINMTTNGRAYCDANSGSTNLADGMEDDFAAFLAEIAEHFSEVEGVDFDVLSPVNEPQWDWESGTQEGCRYAAADIRRVVEALDAETGLGNTHIEIPESGSIVDLFSGEEYLEAFFEPNSPAFVGDKVLPRISSHSYFTDQPSTGLIEQREQLRAALDEYPDLQYAMTEYCPLGDHGPGRDLGMDTALWIARLIHFDLVIAGASSWQWWLAVSPYDYKDGLVYIDRDPVDGEFFESKMLWVMGNFSRFVRPGMVRVGVERSDSAPHVQTLEGLMVSSFLDNDRGIIATVLINRSEESVPVNLQVQGLGIEEWIPFVTSATSDLGAFAAVAAGEIIEVPARSVVTLVGRDPSVLPSPRRPSGRIGPR